MKGYVSKSDVMESQTDNWPEMSKGCAIFLAILCAAPFIAIVIVGCFIL